MFAAWLSFVLWRAQPRLAKYSLDLLLARTHVFSTDIAGSPVGHVLIHFKNVEPEVDQHVLVARLMTR